ncbi:MAG: (2Fe-2S)-binding protein [Egibacteraceae bacterium]
MSSVPCHPPDVDAALRRAASVGPYFAISVGSVAPGATPPWLPVVDLYDPNGSGGLAMAIGTVGDRLNTRERRVAASLFFQGYAGRLWSPVIACLAADEIVPELGPNELSWRYLPDEPVALQASAARGSVVPAGADRLRIAAELAFQSVVTSHLQPLTAAVRREVKIAEPLLWGNAASALVGAVGVLAGQLENAHDVARTARGVLTRLLDTGVLRQTGRLTIGRRGRLFFTRRSCCLYYRAPGGGLCGDCPLRTAKMSAAIERPKVQGP